jgi:hypothetical protein
MRCAAPATRSTARTPRTQRHVIVVLERRNNLTFRGTTLAAHTSRRCARPASHDETHFGRDDDDAVRSAFGLALELPSLAVYATATANEALTLLAEHGADLIFLDLTMPDCNGIDLLRLIRHTIASRRCSSSPASPRNTCRGCERRRPTGSISICFASRST